MKPLGLRGKILLLLLGPLTAFAPTTVFVIHQGVSQVVAREIDSRGQLLARQASLTVTDDVLTGDRAAAEKKLAEFARTNEGVAYAFAMDGNGRVAAHTFSGGFPSDLLAVRTAPRDHRTPPLVLIGGKNVHDVVAPIPDGETGEVHVGVDIGAARATPHVVLLRLTVIGFGVVLAGVVMTLLLSERMARRLGAIASAADSIGAGELDATLHDPSSDEIGRVSKAVTAMATRLRVARDERERTLNRLAQTEKLVAVGRLAAGVAHEINNPLSGVVHCLDNLDDNLEDIESWKSYRDLMREGIVRAQRVVGRLLDYAREHELDVKLVDVTGLLKRSVALLRPSLDRARITVEQRHEQDLPSIQADDHLLEQAVMNLLLNAVEAMPEGGRIEVQSARADGGVRFSVRDTGCGIPAEIAGRVFDPFFTTKGGAKGSGLGLSVTLGIIERHGGTIEMTSAPGRGTEFLVFLPDSLRGERGLDALVRNE